jgi:hypothetical protein
MAGKNLYTHFPPFERRLGCAKLSLAGRRTTRERSVIELIIQAEVVSA